jgi:aspartyl/asparaginyl beta-hydroxylase (cupin superfamily)
VKLDYHIFKSVANGFFGLFIGRKTRPTFFNIGEAYPELDRVTKAYPVIRREFDRLLAEWNELPQYHDVDPGERNISASTPKRWNVFMLEITGHRPAQNRACCPETCRVLEEVPHLIQAFFSILDPGKSVPEHEGPYLGYLRYHLGVRVPAKDPPKLIVNAQDYIWKEGEAVLFDDSWPHSVVNGSNELRAVLIVDVRRPMPLFADLCNRFVTDVIARHTYGRSVARKAEAFASAHTAQRRAAA